MGALHCRAEHPALHGMSCQRPIGHAGVHFDTSHTEMWPVIAGDGSVQPPPPAPTPPPPVIVGIPFGLRPREVEVLQALADGLTTGQTGTRLFLSENTVKTHRARMYKRMGALDGSHAVALGFRAGILK